jgi:hypothetical protein
MARHAALTLATDMPVYFAHPRSPWERGTNEHTNGLVREYLPKGTEITSRQPYLTAIADEMNNRPRATLGFLTHGKPVNDWLLFRRLATAHGFVHPGSEVRICALHELEAGGIPSVFGYPERARELEARGLTPQQYRGHKEALGDATFDQADVRH